jgi:EAL domain-containing protein (putative c-di-GMP-specific phosphodiesterase class I)
MDSLLAPCGLSVEFQPIFEIRPRRSRLHALECLTRGPEGTNFHQAAILFEYARRRREEGVLDRACAVTAFRSASVLPGEPHLSVNVHASTLGRDRGFVAFLHATAELNGLAPERLTVEIVEHLGFWDRPRFLDALEELRRLGIRIALDDVGVGQSNFWMILESRPDYLKVDHYVVQGIHHDPYRQAVIETMAELARKVGARAVAEGVEDSADFHVVTSLGVDLLQGYLLSRPLTASQLIAGGLPVGSGKAAAHRELQLPAV